MVVTLGLGGFTGLSFDRNDRNDHYAKYIKGIFVSMKSGKCSIKIKGGARCGKDVLLDKKYCKEHTPAPPVKKEKKLTTFATGETKFRGEKTVKTSEYDFYIASDNWKEKAAIEKRDNPNCALCNRTGNLHVHHRTYVRCGKEQPGDLIVLCSTCHGMFHDHYKYDGRVGHFKPK